MSGDYSHFTQDATDNPSAFSRWLERLAGASMDFGFNLGVLAFALGIGAYFAMPFEPKLILIVSMSFGLLSLYLILRRKGNFLANIIAYCLIVGFGLSRASWHTHAVETPRLPIQDYSYTVEGWVSAIEKSGHSERYVIDVLSCLLYTSPSPRD